MNFGMRSPVVWTDLGPKKTTRPVPHHYIRLVTELDPSIIPETKPVKSEDIETDETSLPNGVALEGSWMTKQRW